MPFEDQSREGKDEALSAFEQEAYFVNLHRLRIGTAIILAANLSFLYFMDVRNILGLAPELRPLSLATHLFGAAVAGLVLLIGARLAPSHPGRITPRHRTFVRGASLVGFIVAGLTFVLSLRHQGVSTTYIFSILFYAVLLSDPGRFDLALFGGNVLFFQLALLRYRPSAPVDVDGLVATIAAYAISRQSLRWRRREFEARRTIEEQGRTIEAANRELSRAKASADTANQQKTRFLAQMSHEVRTPMNGVLGVAGLLLETPLSEEQRRYASAIRGSGEALLRVLDDILDLSKVEAGRLALVPSEFELRRLAEEALDLFRETCRARGVRLALQVEDDVAAWVRADAGRLRQVLLNLVGNAAKFTTVGEIVLAVSVAKDTAAEQILRFEVNDSGAGIPEGAGKELFQRFAQAGGSSKGTGLGLSICRELVALMGGEIGFDSEIGRGSRFWFTVRVARAEAPSATPESAAAHITRYEGRVLLAEDDAVSRMLMTQLLERRGLEVNVVENGRDAAGAVLASVYDLVLMDGQMTNLDGYQAAREIRAREVGRRTPIVMVSADVLGEQRRRALEAGVDGVLAKPVREADLDRVLASRFSSASARPPAASLGDLRHAMGTMFPLVVRRYLADGPSILAELRDAAAVGDGDRLRAEAHRLKGASAFLGAARVADLCERLTQTFAAGAATTDLVRDVELEFERTRATMEAAVKA